MAFPELAGDKMRMFAYRHNGVKIWDQELIAACSRAKGAFPVTDWTPSYYGFGVVPVHVFDTTVLDPNGHWELGGDG